MYKVEGFYFKDAEMAKQASKEIEGIRYIREHADMDNPDMVLKVYNQLVKERLFATPVGLAYLRELQAYLYEVSYIDNDEIEMLYVDDFYQFDGKKPRRYRAPAPRRSKKPDDFYRGRYYVSTFFAVVLAICVIGMFAITISSGNNINILNYENKLIDKYEVWENHLKDREKKLDKRESEIRERESELGMETETATASEAESGPASP